MPRFVVLEHLWNGVHFDVMLEHVDSLRTWAIDAPVVAGVVLPARSLPDHRLAYLGYEGAISGDRGSVTRIVEGTYSVREWSDDRVVVLLDGPQLKGEAMFVRDGGGAWSFCLRPGKAD